MGWRWSTTSCKMVIQHSNSRLSLRSQSSTSKVWLTSSSTRASLIFLSSSSSICMSINTHWSSQQLSSHASKCLTVRHAHKTSSICSVSRKDSTVLADLKIQLKPFIPTFMSLRSEERTSERSASMTSFKSITTSTCTSFSITFTTFDWVASSRKVKSQTFAQREFLLI